MLKITVDRREDLAVLLQRAGLEVAIADLPSADYRWEGQGPKGSCIVGLERKRLRDFITSDNYGRLLEQCSKMSRDCAFSYLLLEAIIRPQPETGYLETYDYRSKSWRVVFNRGLSLHYRTLMGKLWTFSLFTPFTVLRSRSAYESAALIESLVHWWSKRWADHSTHRKFFNLPPPTVSIEPPPLLDRMGKELPGVGWEKASNLRYYFRSVIAMVCAGEGLWRRVPGIGKTLSWRIVRALRGVRE